MSFGVGPFPTKPTEQDFKERAKFRNNIKICLGVFSFLTVVCLAVGIYLLADPGKTN